MNKHNIKKLTKIFLLTSSLSLAMFTPFSVIAKKEIRVTDTNVTQIVTNTITQLSKLGIVAPVNCQKTVKNSLKSMIDKELDFSECSENLIKLAKKQENPVLSITFANIHKQMVSDEAKNEKHLKNDRSRHNSGTSVQSTASVLNTKFDQTVNDANKLVVERAEKLNLVTEIEGDKITFKKGAAFDAPSSSATFSRTIASNEHGKSATLPKTLKTEFQKKSNSLGSSKLISTSNSSIVTTTSTESKNPIFAGLFNSQKTPSVVTKDFVIAIVTNSPILSNTTTDQTDNILTKNIIDLLSEEGNDTRIMNKEGLKFSDYQTRLDTLEKKLKHQIDSETEVGVINDKLNLLKQQLGILKIKKSLLDQQYINQMPNKNIPSTNKINGMRVEIENKIKNITQQLQSQTFQILPNRVHDLKITLSSNIINDKSIKKLLGGEIIAKTANTQGKKGVNILDQEVSLDKFIKKMDEAIKIVDDNIKEEDTKDITKTKPSKLKKLHEQKLVLLELKQKKIKDFKETGIIKDKAESKKIGENIMNLNGDIAHLKTRIKEFNKAEVVEPQAPVEVVNNNQLPNEQNIALTLPTVGENLPENNQIVVQTIPGSIELPVETIANNALLNNQAIVHQPVLVKKEALDPLLPKVKAGKINISTEIITNASKVNGIVDGNKTKFLTQIFGDTKFDIITGQEIKGLVIISNENVKKFNNQITSKIKEIDKIIEGTYYPKLQKQLKEKKLELLRFKAHIIDDVLSKLDDTEKAKKETKWKKYRSEHDIKTLEDEINKFNTKPKTSPDETEKLNPTFVIKERTVSGSLNSHSSEISTPKINRKEADPKRKFEKETREVDDFIKNMNSATSVKKLRDISQSFNDSNIETPELQIKVKEAIVKKVENLVTSGQVFTDEDLQKLGIKQKVPKCQKKSANVNSKRTRFYSESTIQLPNCTDQSKIRPTSNYTSTINLNKIDDMLQDQFLKTQGTFAQANRSNSTRSKNSASNQSVNIPNLEKTASYTSLNTDEESDDTAPNSRDIKLIIKHIGETTNKAVLNSEIKNINMKLSYENQNLINRAIAKDRIKKRQQNQSEECNDYSSDDDDNSLSQQLAIKESSASNSRKTSFSSKISIDDEDYGDILNKLFKIPPQAKPRKKNTDNELFDQKTQTELVPTAEDSSNVKVSSAKQLYTEFKDNIAGLDEQDIKIKLKDLHTKILDKKNKLKEKFNDYSKNDNLEKSQSKLQKLLKLNELSLKACDDSLDLLESDNAKIITNNIKQKLSTEIEEIETELAKHKDSSNLSTNNENMLSDTVETIHNNDSSNPGSTVPDSNNIISTSSTNDSSYSASTVSDSNNIISTSTTNDSSYSNSFYNSSDYNSNYWSSSSSSCSSWDSDYESENENDTEKTEKTEEIKEVNIIIPENANVANIPINHLSEQAQQERLDFKQEDVTKNALATAQKAVVIRMPSNLQNPLTNSLDTKIDAGAGSDDEVQMNCGIWFSGTYGVNKQYKHVDRTPYEGEMNAANIGFDFEQDGEVMGISYSFIKSNLKYAIDNDKTDSIMHALSLYGSKNLKSNFSIQMIAQVASTNIDYIDYENNVELRKMNGNMKSFAFNTTLNYTYHTKFGSIIIPNIGIDYSNHQGDVFQHNEKINLQNLSKQRNFAAAQFGLKIIQPIICENNVKVTPSISFNGKKYVNKLLKPDSNTNYNIELGLNVSKDRYNVGVEYDLNMDNKNYVSHQGSMRIKVKL